MEESTPAAAEARKTPWRERTSEQRRAIYEEREAKRKKNLDRRLDRIEKRFGQRGDTPAPSARKSRGRSSFGDPNATIWDYLPHPILLALMAVVFVVVFVVLVLVL